MKIETSPLGQLPLSRVKDKVVAEKLVQETDGNQTKTNKKDLKSIDVSSLGFNEVFGHNVSRNQAIDEMMVNHPDLELAASILVSSIISPNDAVHTSLHYKSDSVLVSPSTTFKIFNFLSKELKNKYNLESDIDDIVKESYITRGSYSRLFISDVKLNNIINSGLEDVSLESINDDIGDKISLESSDPELNTELGKYVSIVDDVSILNIDKEYNKLLQDSNRVSDDTSIESIKTAIKTRDKKSNMKSLFKLLKSDSKPIDLVDMTGDEELNGERCIVMKIPNEAVVPLYLSNDPSEAYGYYIMLDGKGSPLKRGVEINNGGYDPKKMINSLVEKSRSNLNSASAKAPAIKDIDKLTSDVIDNKLEKALLNNNKNNIYLNKEAKDRIFKVMLGRTLKNNKTKLLYVPATQLSYYAFNYRENGTGKPILDDLLVQSSLRTMVKFSKVSALIRNNIPNVKVDVQLDNDDPDAPKTMESVRAYVMNTRSLSLPIGLNKTTDVVDWLHKYGFSFNFKHDSLPDMSIDTSEESRSHVVPDEEVETELGKSMYMKLGLTPEMIENSKGADFATTIIANNLLFAKRIIRLQATFNKKVTLDVINFIYNDGYIKNVIKNLISIDLKKSMDNINKDKRKELKVLNIPDEDIVDYVLEDLTSNMDVTLPPVDLLDTNGNKEAYDNYADSIDDYMESFFSEDSLPTEYATAIGDDLDMVQSALKSTLLRQWMKERGYMPELADAFVSNSAGEVHLDIFDEYKVYMDNVLDSFKKFKKGIKKPDEQEDDGDGDNTEDDNEINDESGNDLEEEL